MTFILPGLVGMLAVPTLVMASSSDVLPTIPALGATTAGLIAPLRLIRWASEKERRFKAPGMSLHSIAGFCGRSIWFGSIGWIPTALRTDPCR